MVWTTKKLGRDRKYIVVKHSLRGINYTIKGIKFRDGYAVVEKDSKLYFQLKSMKPAAIVEEYPLNFLNKLQFITRTKDIEMVYGKDVYYYYVNKVRQAKKEEEDKKHLESDKCKMRLANDQFCKNESSDLSPSEYCLMHILSDPKLSELGIEIPEKIYGKEQKRKFKEEVLERLQEIRSKKDLESLEVSDVEESSISEA